MEKKTSTLKVLGLVTGVAVMGIATFAPSAEAFDFSSLKEKAHKLAQQAHSLAGQADKLSSEVEKATK